MTAHAVADRRVPALVEHLDPVRTAPGPARRHLLFVICGVVVLAVTAGVSWGVANPDGFQDLAGLAGRIGSALVRLRWQFGAIVVLLAGLHYLATAVTARAAAGIRLNLRETVLVQLAAAAANRLTPAGLGGSALNARYFTRRGVDRHAAVGAVAVMGLLGAVADLVVLSLLVFGGRLVGLGGAVQGISVLHAKLAGITSTFTSVWLWVAALAVVTAGAGLWLALRRRHDAGGWRRIFDPVVDLVRHPRRLAVLMTASGSTTLVLALAFAASVAMVPGSAPHTSTAGLLVAFMAGAAAGNAIPTPAGIGSAEVAFVAVLVALGVPAAHALEVVLIFRLITFWLPAVVGVFAARGLRRAQTI
jgi:uncharacterized membrane protein YbhN (UPF0104 family)